MATRTKKRPNKSAFVRDFVQNNPTANRKAVEEAWQQAGNEGTISSALVSNLRSKLGLTGNLRSGSRTAAGDGAPEAPKTTARTPKRKQRGRGAKGKVIGFVAESIKEPVPRIVGRKGALAEIEADIDRLIFKLIGLGGMETMEDELRKVRRLLYRSYQV
jgi:hypothetical protein